MNPASVCERLAPAGPRSAEGAAASASAEPQERARLERSLGELEIALVARPQSLELQCLRARTLLLLGRDLQARAAYLEILRREADHMEALTNLGRNLAINGFRAEARPLLERAVQCQPDDPVGLVNLGTLLYQSEETQAARALYERALRVAPDNPLAHAGLFYVWSRLGEADKAAYHQRLGFAGRAIAALPFRGHGAPVRVLLLASTYNGNVPLERHLDARTFQTWIVSPEFLGANQALPDHDLIVNAIGDPDSAAAALRAAGAVVSRSRAPVINDPARVAATGRCENLRRLATIPGVRVPRVQRMGRRALQEAGAAAMLAEQGLRFPFLLRSPGFHTGEHFLRVESPQGLRAALVQLPGEDFLALEYLDARGADGKTRKYRVMMIGGELMPLHLAIAADWKVHYFSADMARNERHRAEEARFLERMPEVLGERAMRALQRIQLLLGLEYAGIDFALGKDGELIVFEANATMNIVPAAPEAMWAYRRSAVERADAAVRRLLMGERALSPADAAGGRDGVVVGPGPSPGPAAVMRAAPAGQSAEFLAEDLALGANELNFSAGPGALPLAVLQEAQQAILALPETGLSVLGMSHRSAWFEALLQEAEANLRRLLDIPASHAVLFLQGGSSLQFSMIPQNFAAGRGAEPLHLRTGYWSAKAIEEGRCARPLQVAWDGGPGGYRLLPRDADIASGPPGTPYLHYVSNETVEGLQFAQPPRLPGIALIADMSSDFLSRPIDFERHAMVYAHAQKNLGPAGVTVCVLDRELLERVPAGLPPMLDYRTHLRHGSNYNTPPVFGIYVLTLVTRWVRDSVGGIARMALRNRDKAQSLYDELECLEGFVNIHADPGFRSEMNASFRFGDPRLDGLFLEEAAAAGFSGLAGHRSLGGLRTSLYNAVSPAAVKQLCGFIRRFATRHG